MKKILNSFLYIFINNITKFLSWVFFRLKVEGRANLPEKGPFIIASNHASFLDSAVIQVAIPARISWIAKRGVYEERLLKPLHYIFGTIPMNGAIEKALTALENGETIGIFPEGTRSTDGKIKEADVGIAILALKSGKTVVPVGVKGSFEAFPPGKKFFRPYPVTVKIGKPISFEKRDKETIEVRLLEEAKNRVMDRIGELLV